MLSSAHICGQGQLTKNSVYFCDIEKGRRGWGRETSTYLPYLHVCVFGGSLIIDSLGTERLSSEEFAQVSGL